MTRVIAALAAVVTLAGCAAPAWQNTDASRDTSEAYRRDENDCREQNLYRNQLPRWGEHKLFPHLVVDEERAAECLKARGWRPRANR